MNEFGKLSKTNNSIIIPSNLSGIAGVIKSAASVIKEQVEADTAAAQGTISRSISDRKNARAGEQGITFCRDYLNSL